MTVHRLKFPGAKRQRRKNKKVQPADPETAEELELIRDRTVAYHQAGYVVAVLEVLPNALRSVSIDPVGGEIKWESLSKAGWKTVINSWPQDALQDLVFAHVCIGISGYLGQHYSGEKTTTRDAGDSLAETEAIIRDTRRARGVITPTAVHADRDRLVTSAKDRMMRVILRESEFLKMLAHDLYFFRTRSAADVYALYEELWRGPKHKIKTPKI